MLLTCQDNLGKNDKRTERGAECRQGSGGMPYAVQRPRDVKEGHYCDGQAARRAGAERIHHGGCDAGDAQDEWQFTAESQGRGEHGGRYSDGIRASTWRTGRLAAGSWVARLGLGDAKCATRSGRATVRSRAGGRTAGRRGVGERRGEETRPTTDEAVKGSSKPASVGLAAWGGEGGLARWAKAAVGQVSGPGWV